MKGQRRQTTLWGRMGITAAVAAVVICGGCAAGGAGTVVRTDGGSVSGVLRHGVLEFRGIPYAAAPVGELRWALPRPAPPWEGVRDGGSFGPACAQEARFGLTEASDSEDCLTVNVSRPADIRPGEKLPVLFWIHGGAFVGGSSSLYRLDRLAGDGRMVVVSANYRLGVFGFMAHPAFDAATNGGLGLEDQRFALGWVQRNIAAFGGDPDNVTVAGESAGGGSVCMHLASPERVTGLFHKAIVQSAGCLQPLPTLAETLAGETAAWKTVTAAAGCDGTPADAAATLACLRAAPTAALLAAQGKASSGVMAFGPTIGTAAVPRSAADAAATGALMKVPLLMGGTRDELRLYVAYSVLYPDARVPTPDPPFSRDALYAFWFPYFYGTATSSYDAIYDHYFGTGPGGMGWPITGATVGSMVSDHTPAVGINNCLYLKTADAFTPWLPALYQFEFADRAAPVLGVGIARGLDPGFELGPVHSSELNYLFPNLSNTAAMDGPPLAPASQQLADLMVRSWARFAATGSPAGPGLPPWPRYAGGSTVMLLEPGQVGPYDAAVQHSCSFWQGLYP